MCVHVWGSECGHLHEAKISVFFLIIPIVVGHINFFFQLLSQLGHLLLKMVIRSVNILSRTGHSLPVILKLKMTNMYCVTCFFSYMYLGQEGELISIGNFLFVLLLDQFKPLLLKERGRKNIAYKSFLHYVLLHNKYKWFMLMFRFYICSFLKKLYANAQECPRSYDKLRFDPR